MKEKRMYIHLGNGKMLRERELIGIFDLDAATQSKITRACLSKAEKEGRLEVTSEDLPRSLVLTDGMIYMSVLSVKALCGRAVKDKQIQF